MQSVFLDANIFFAAVRSSKGGSYFIIELAKKKMVKVVTVAHALAEAERNIGEKLGNGRLALHYENLLLIRPIIQSLASYPSDLEQKLAFAVLEKDIPILLGAILSNADVLITLDRKHLLENKKLHALKPGVPIMTPGDFIRSYFL